MHDPVARVGGLFHYMLPLSVLDARKAGERPFMYCDSGLPLLIRCMVEAGADRKRMAVFAAGGANVLDDKGYFNIGQKNEQILRQMLAGYKITLRAQDFGGTTSRTVGLDVASGRFWIKQLALGNGAAPARCEQKEL